MSYTESIIKSVENVKQLLEIVKELKKKLIKRNAVLKHAIEKCNENCDQEWRNAVGNKRVDLRGREIIPPYSALKKITVLCGPSGYGKSHALRLYCGNMLEAAEQQKIIPLFLSAQMYKRYGSLRSCIATEYFEGWAKQGKGLQKIFQLCKKYHFVILFDSWDLVDDLKAFNAELDELCTKIANIKVIIAAKIETETNENERTMIEKFYTPSWCRVESEKWIIVLRKYSDEIVNQEIDKATKDNREISAATKNNEKLYELLHIPIMLAFWEENALQKVCETNSYEISMGLFKRVLEGDHGEEQKRIDLIKTHMLILPLAAIGENFSQNKNLQKGINWSIRKIKEFQDGEEFRDYLHRQHIEQGQFLIEDGDFLRTVDDEKIKRFNIINQDSQQQYNWNSNDYYLNWYTAQGVRLLMELEEFRLLGRYFRQLYENMGEESERNLRVGFDNISKYELVIWWAMQPHDKVLEVPEYLLFLSRVIHLYDQIGKKVKQNQWERETLRQLQQNKDKILEQDYVKCVIIVAYRTLHLHDEGDETRCENINCAIQAYREILDICKQRQDYWREQGHAYGDLGACCLAQKNLHDQGIIQCEKCLVRNLTVIEEGERNNCSLCAQEFHKKSLETKKERLPESEEKNKDISRSYTCLGTDAYHQQDYRKSLNYHRQAIEMLGNCKSAAYQTERWECYERYCGTFEKYFEEREQENIPAEYCEKNIEYMSLWLESFEGNHGISKLASGSTVQKMKVRYLKVQSGLSGETISEMERKFNELERKYGG